MASSFTSREQQSEQCHSMLLLLTTVVETFVMYKVSAGDYLEIKQIKCYFLSGSQYSSSPFMGYIH